MKSLFSPSWINNPRFIISKYLVAHHFLSFSIWRPLYRGWNPEVLDQGRSHLSVKAIYITICQWPHKLTHMDIVTHTNLQPWKGRGIHVRIHIWVTGLHILEVKLWVHSLRWFVEKKYDRTGKFKGYRVVYSRLPKVRKIAKRWHGTSGHGDKQLLSRLSCFWKHSYDLMGTPHLAAWTYLV